ncbi:hypothetical protein HGB25_03310, partial [Candidatus Saccharibacteria bacterium]|nr:hypothetical protein [Candidatus Saccharibacteria bacterium]
MAAFNRISNYDGAISDYLSSFNADGTRDPHYDMAKAINADVKAIGDILCKAESVNVFP